MKNFIHNFRRFRLLAIVFSLICSAATSAWAQAPVITDFTATASTGSTIYIEGANFAGATLVEFGSPMQPGYTSAAPSSITLGTPNVIQVAVPKGATIGNLTVHTPAGSVQTASAFTPFVTWIGGMNGIWDDESNWSDGEVPVQTTNVVINSGRPTINSLAVCNNLSNQTGLVLTTGADLKITGIFQNLSSFTQSGGKITFMAPTGLQQIPALTYNDITIAGGGEKQLLGNTAINGVLKFESSNLSTVNPATTQLTLNGSIQGEKVGSSYIGKLVKTRLVDQNTSSDVFGNIGVHFNNAGNGNWGLVVVTRISGSAISNPGNPSYQSINRYWDIVPQNPNTNTLVSLTLTWLTSENNNLQFPNNKAQAWRSEDNGASWTPVDLPQTISTTTANGERSITVATKTFSKWGISDENNPLPVSWLYFNGKTTSAGNLLNWATASEKNSESFVVERSVNGKSFEAIGTVKAAGNSNQVLTYSFTDAMPAASKTYYRLKQTDMDGAFSYSSIIVVSNSDKKGTIEAGVYPNPFAESLNLKLQPNDFVKEVRLLSLDGKEVYRKTVENATSVTLDRLPALKPGMYLLQLHGTNGITTLKIARQ